MSKARQSRNRAHERRPLRRNAFGQNFRTGHTGGAGRDEIRNLWIARPARLHEWIKQHLRIKSFFGTSTNALKTQIWIAVSIYLLAPVRHPQHNDQDVWKGRFFMSQTRKIITSVAFMRAAAVCPRFSCISLAERAVMIDVIC